MTPIKIMARAIGESCGGFGKEDDGRVAEFLVGALEEAGYAIIPDKLTYENGMKAALSGEFYERYRYIDDDGEERYAAVPVTWITIKEIHKAMLEVAKAKP